MISKAERSAAIQILSSIAYEDDPAHQVVESALRLGCFLDRFTAFSDTHSQQFPNAEGSRLLVALRRLAADGVTPNHDVALLWRFEGELRK